MPRGARPGERRGGRKKGSIPRKSQQAAAILDKFDVDPLEKLALIADRRVPCRTCIDADRKPTGKTKFRLPEGKHAKGCTGIPLHATGMCPCEGVSTRTCESCFGTLWERIPVSEMSRASSALAPYRYPQLRAIEHSGSIDIYQKIEERLLAGRKRAGKV